MFKAVSCYSVIKSRAPDRLSKKQCPFCFKVLCNTYKLQRHVVSMHSGEKPFECDTCHKRYSRKDTLRAHKLLIKCQQPLQNSRRISVLTAIKFCPKKDTWLDTYCPNTPACNRAVQGLPALSELRVNQCPHCFDILSQKKHLARHIRSKHTNVRPFQCNYCGKKFSRRVELGPTSLVAENQWQCQYCRDVLSSKNHLKRHIASRHTNERPFECNICGKRFSNEQKAKRLDKNQCPYCHEILKRNLDLRKHMASKHGEDKPFECNICERRFSRKDGLKNHMVTHLKWDNKGLYL
ncbi:ZN782-like protein [Mya arenaria]|uniref:ZN782-like protein n=1 Tax=Mya arenaria TaxID=6604 RepID=A0ABY7F6W4_MYAAR|nr:ZN782-like protein [Mya arenaria]